jgi:general secretion pathway protein E
LLRQDPDVIMIGEMRDPETAQLALETTIEEVIRVP